MSVNKNRSTSAHGPGPTRFISGQQIFRIFDSLLWRDYVSDCSHVCSILECDVAAITSTWSLDWGWPMIALLNHRTPNDGSQMYRDFLSSMTSNQSFRKLRKVWLWECLRCVFLLLDRLLRAPGVIEALLQVCKGKKGWGLCFYGMMKISILIVYSLWLY